MFFVRVYVALSGILIIQCQTVRVGFVEKGNRPFLAAVPLWLWSRISLPLQVSWKMANPVPQTRQDGWWLECPKGSLIPSSSECLNGYDESPLLTHSPGGSLKLLAAWIVRAELQFCHFRGQSEPCTTPRPQQASGLGAAYLIWNPDYTC